MHNKPVPLDLATLQLELDANAVKIAQVAIILKYLLRCYTDYYAQLLHEAAPFNSDIPGMVERLQFESLEMESLTRSLSSLQRTFQPQSPALLRIMNSDAFEDHCWREAGKFFL